MFPRVQAATELATFGVVQAATELAGEGGTDMVQSFLGLESNWLGSRACGQNGYGEWYLKNIKILEMVHQVPLT